MDLLTPSLDRALLAAYYVVLGILALYGVHRVVLVVRYLATRNRRHVTPPAPNEWPRVTVQLPLYNEVYVAERLLRAAAALDYPRDRLEIQVLDDSTDDTTAVVRRLVAELQTRGVPIVHLHRTERTGYKAGALAAGLERASGELVAIFDADFVPSPGFLRYTVPHFRDPEIGMVQARWEHLNRGYSLLTKVEAILLDGHFAVEHTARERSGCFFNFNGTAGIWRRRAIEEAGGWQHDTLTEDLDLSYRAQLAGWRFLYLPELTVPAELPVDVDAFKSQQHRWAKGAIQTGRKLLGRLLAAPLDWRIKLEGFVHLTNNVSYPLMILLSLLIFPAMVLRHGSATWQILTIDLPLFAAATLSVVAFYLTSQHAAERDLSAAVRLLPATLAAGIGLAVNNTVAVLEGATQSGGVFHRTPKYRVEGERRLLLPSRYRVRRRLSFVAEGLLAAYFLVCTGAACALELWMSLPFLYLFLQGYAYLFVLSVMEGREPKRQPTPLGAAAIEEPG